MSNKIANDIYDVKLQIANLKDEMQLLTNQKRSLESEMQLLNNRVKMGGQKKTNGRLPTSEYKSICRNQRRISEEVAIIEEKMSPIRSRLRQLYAKEDKLRVDANIFFGTVHCASKGNDNMTNLITELRNKHLSLSEDKSKLSTLRLMSGHFAKELTDILSDS